MIHLKANMFHQDATELSQEASSLQLPPGTDMKQDITVTSTDGREMLYTYTGSSMNDGGEDIGEWSYKPVDTTSRIKVLTIWND